MGVCVAIANIIFSVESVKDNCTIWINLIKPHLRNQKSSVFALLCDIIYQREFEGTEYFLFGKGILCVEYSKLYIEFTDDLTQLISASDRTLSATTRTQLARVNRMIEIARRIRHEVPTEELAPKSENKKSWLLNSPSRCERVITDILLAIILVAGPSTVSLTAFNSMFDFMPKLIFSHLSSTANWTIGITSGGLAFVFIVVDLLRIVLTSNYQDKLFKRGCSDSCKAFCFRVIGAHEKSDEPQTVTDPML